MLKLRVSMKAVIRIAVLLIAIVGLALAGLTGTSSTRAYTYCNAPVYQDPPAGYRFACIIQCDGEMMYELWEEGSEGPYIRRPSY